MQNTLKKILLYYTQYLFWGGKQTYTTRDFTSHQSLPATRSILGIPTKKKQAICRGEGFIKKPVLLFIAAFDLDAKSWVCEKSIYFFFLVFWRTEMHLDVFFFLIGGNGKRDENAPYPLIYKPMLFIPWEISLSFLFREKKIEMQWGLSLYIYEKCTKKISIQCLRNLNFI